MEKIPEFEVGSIPINFGFLDKLGSEIKEICSKGLTQKSRRFCTTINAAVRIGTTLNYVVRDHTGHEIRG